MKKLSLVVPVYYEQEVILQFLKERSPEKFDLIILDPPSFSRSKKMIDVLDIQKDHRWMLERCYQWLTPGGQVIFSTNLRTFKLEQEVLQDIFDIKEITSSTLPEDFRNEKIHKVYLLRK